MANRDFFRRLGLAAEVATPTLTKLKQPEIVRRLLLSVTIQRRGWQRPLTAEIGRAVESGF
jgi:hypothetical protein